MATVAACTGTAAVPIGVAWTVKLAALAPAVPAGAAGPNTSQLGNELLVTRKGVPRLAADVTETVWGAPATKVRPPALFPHVTVTLSATSAYVADAIVLVTVRPLSVLTAPPFD